MPPHGRAGLGSTAAAWTSAAIGLGMLGLVLSPPSRSVLAQVPGVSREELVRKWDLDRNGKLDASEVEIARIKMRKMRGEAAMKSEIDPLTGRPRPVSDPAQERTVPTDEPRGPGALGLGVNPSDDARDDEGLILVPGTGERPPAAAESPVTPLPKRPPAPSAARDRAALPGTRVPLPPTVPSGVPPAAAARGPAPQANEADARRRVADPATRPGVIAGGMRAGVPAGRSTASESAAAELNAGRLPAGLPQVRGGNAGVAAGTRGLQPGAQQVPGTSRLARPGNQPGAGGGADPRQPASAPRGPAGSAVRTTAPEAGSGRRWPPGAVPGVSGQPAPRAGVPPRQTVPPPSTVPRPPRVSVGDIYAR